MVEENQEETFISGSSEIPKRRGRQSPLKQSTTIGAPSPPLSDNAVKICRGAAAHLAVHARVPDQSRTPKIRNRRLPPMTKAPAQLKSSRKPLTVSTRTSAEDYRSVLSFGQVRK